MSSKFSLLASAMPTFTKKTTVEAKVDALADYQVQLLEYLRYTLTNLDADNFNASGLNEILNPVVAEIKNAEGDILSLWLTAEELAVKLESNDEQLGSLQSEIKQTSNQISAVVSSVGDGEGNVTAASIVAAINAAGSSVRISADHIELEGDLVTITDLKTGGAVVIDGGNVSAGTISGAAFYTEGYSASGDPLSISSVYIHGGTIELDGAMIYRLFGDVNISVPGSDNAVLLRVGNYEWGFDRYGIRLNGIYLVSA